MPDLNYTVLSCIHRALTSGDEVYDNSINLLCLHNLKYAPLRGAAPIRKNNRVSIPPPSSLHAKLSAHAGTTTTWSISTSYMVVLGRGFESGARGIVKCGRVSGSRGGKRSWSLVLRSSAYRCRVRDKMQLVSCIHVREDQFADLSKHKKDACRRRGERRKKKKDHTSIPKWKSRLHTQPH